MIDQRTTISMEPPKRAKDTTNHGSQFDHLIEGWNAKSSFARSEIRRICQREGHQWANVVYRGKVQYVICRRCCEYTNDGR